MKLKRHQAIGLIILLLIGLQWVVGTCAKYNGPAYALARQIRDAGLPVDGIEAQPMDGAHQQASLQGDGFKATVIHFGSAGLYRKMAGMMGQAGGKKDPKNADKLVAVWAREPDLVLSYVDKDKAGLEEALGRALEGFSKQALGRDGG